MNRQVFLILLLKLFTVYGLGVCPQPLLSQNQEKPSDWMYKTACQQNEATPCPETLYRSIDGSCNNLVNPEWGKAVTPYIRICDAKYKDNVHEVTMAVEPDTDLPKARLLSENLLDLSEYQDDVWTELFGTYTQFVAHDITQSLGSDSKPETNGGGCCVNETSETCLIMEIQKTDSFYQQFPQGPSCMEVTRSHVITCDNDPSQQINNYSHYIDLSQVYGSDEPLALSLRTQQDGKMATFTTPEGTQLLPRAQIPDPSRCNKDSICSNAGDMLRNNQNPALQTIHVRYVRMHNKLAEILANLDGSLDDEEIYQKTRRVLTALYQNTVYKEIVTGYIGKEIPYQGYDADVPAVILNEFTASALRVDHTILRGDLQIIRANASVEGYQMSDQMQDSRLVEKPGNLDGIIRGLYVNYMQAVDSKFSQETNGLLLKTFFQANFGIDLSAVDILRGRDHGVPSYVTILNYCKAIEIYHFPDLVEQGIMSVETVQKLVAFYNDVEDVDAFLGILLEEKPKGQLFPDTFNCLFEEQFYRLQHGDRFYYEVQGQPHSFSDAQLNEIRKFSVATLICETSDEITEVPEKPLFGLDNPVEPNSMKSCEDIPTPDYSILFDISN